MNKKRVMVVDDNEYSLKLTRIYLEQAGKYDIMTLSSAKDIISRLHEFKPDLILLDMLMPNIGGIEACEMMNNDPLGKNVPIIVFSALEKDQDKLKAYKKGVVDYIVKPIDKKDLISKIEKAFQYK